jgi:phosphate-selective porin OprO and OprP
VRRVILSVFVGITLLLGDWMPGALAQGNKEKPVIEQILDLLLQRGRLSQEEYRSLQEKARQEQASGKQGQVSGIQAGIARGRPFLRSADGNFRIDLGGRLHIESDFTDSMPLRDVYLDFKLLSELRLRGGQFKVPFSLEELTSDLFIDFVERSLINELAPSYDAGAMVYGSMAQGMVSYFLGGFNGSGQNTSDNNPDKDLAARFVFAPFTATDDFWLKGFQIAGDVTWGNQGSFRTARGRTEARVPNRFEYFARQPAQGNRTRFGGDLAWVVGPASFKFEYDEEIDHRDGLGPGGSDLDSVKAKGWYVSGTYLLTGEERVFNGPVIPRRPFNPIADRAGLGAWELGVRFAELKFSSDDPVNFFDGNLSKIPGGGSSAENGAKALTLGVNWYLNERVRAMLNWTNYWYDNWLGTLFSCPTTTCTAANLRSRDDTFWEILSRLQVWF